MTKGRLEAFSDGVIAIIITIMVLELKVPHGESLAALLPLVPVLLSYVLSFIYVGIYWNNHHHMLHASTKVNGPCCGPTCICFSGYRWCRSSPAGWARIISARCRWLFMLCAIAYTVLLRGLIRLHGANSTLAHAIGRDRKGMISMAIYAAAIPLAFVDPWISMAL